MAAPPIISSTTDGMTASGLALAHVAAKRISSPVVRRSATSRRALYSGLSTWCRRVSASDFVCQLITWLIRGLCVTQLILIREQMMSQARRSQADPLTFLKKYLCAKPPFVKNSVLYCPHGEGVPYTSSSAYSWRLIHGDF